jgi:hypothetical protein
MGFFSSRPKLPDYSDKVWKDDEHAIKGMLTEAPGHLVKNEIPIITTYFKESHEKLVSFLNEKSVPYFIVDSNNYQEALSKSKEVLVIDPSFLTITIQKLFPQLTVKFKCHLQFLGHYPLPAKENKLLESLNNFKNLTLTFYSSLDNPLMAAFGAGNIISLMEKLGMKDDEAIEHAMVTKAMQNARKKLEEKVSFEHPANSEKEWFEKNLPQSH